MTRTARYRCSCPWTTRLVTLFFLLGYFKGMLCSCIPRPLRTSWHRRCCPQALSCLDCSRSLRSCLLCQAKNARQDPPGCLYPGCHTEPLAPMPVPTERWQSAEPSTTCRSFRLPVLHDPPHWRSRLGPKSQGCRCTLGRGTLRLFLLFRFPMPGRSIVQSAILPAHHSIPSLSENGTSQSHH